jgi:hypothetical protein
MFCLEELAQLPASGAVSRTRLLARSPAKPHPPRAMIPDQLFFDSAYGKIAHRLVNSSPSKKTNRGYSKRG